MKEGAHICKKTDKNKIKITFAKCFYFSTRQSVHFQVPVTGTKVSESKHRQKGPQTMTLLPCQIFLFGIELQA